MTLDPLDLLPLSARAELERTCALLEIPVRTWARVPWLQTWVEVIAVGTEADRIAERRGCTRTVARALAASRAGVDVETHRSRLGRAKRDAFDPERDSERFRMHPTKRAS